MNNKNLQKATRVLAKLGEVAHWIAAVGSVVGLVLTFFPGMVVFDPLTNAGQELTVYGFEATIVGADGALNMGALRLVLIAGVFLFGLMAMVFRNVYLILKSSENASPFQKDNVRMVREIGIFLVAQPVVGLIADIIGRLVLGHAAELSVSLSGIVIGLVVLCLSQFFARGLALESDVDGLV